MRPTPYVASLRVYEPLTVFERENQTRWIQTSAIIPSDQDEQHQALFRTITSRPIASKPDGVYVIEVNGEKYIAPWSTAARCITALETSKSFLPSPVRGFFISQQLEESILLQSESFQDKIPHILSANWNIPPRWFALFDPSDRITGTSNNEVFMKLRTSISKAKQKCLFAHQTVVNAFGNGPIEQEIGALLQWLSVFDSDSIVECDYGGLAGYLEKTLIESGHLGLNADSSVEDVANSLAGLASGDGAMAGHGYEKLIKRWRKVAEIEQAM